VKGKEVVVVSL